MPTPSCDIALAYDPVTRKADVVLAVNAAGALDFALDTTARTPMLVALGCDRRARTDDVLPQDVTDFSAPETLVGRRGWCGDCCDALGRLCGSRLWLLDREKQSEATRLKIQSAAAEALGQVEIDRDVSIALQVSWVRRNVAALVATAGRVKVTLFRGVAT